MCKMHFLSCMALTLAFIADGAPTVGPSKETQQQLEQLVKDLQQLLERANSYKSPERATMLTFKFYVPKEATELRHLQCLMEELKALEEVLKISPSRDFHSQSVEDIVSNINVTVLELKGPGASPRCEFEEETVTAVELLGRWITFCQSIFSALPQGRH